MSFWYKIRRAASILGALLFLIFGLATYSFAGNIGPQISIIWEQAQLTILCFAGTLVGSSLFVWGMGWTMDTKERDKMKKKRKEEAEKKRKIAELEKRRAKLLRKHGLSKDIK